jgi:hypothetical protein
MSQITNSLRVTSQERETLQTLESSLLNRLVPVLYKFQKRFPHKSLSPFFTQPLESQRSFPEWCEGFLTLTAKLEEASRAVELEPMMKYLACCDEGGVIGLSFSLVVEEFYQDYGFSGST